MKDLRLLLIDCRIGLRKAQRDFERSELCERLDETIQAMGKPGATGPTLAPAAAPAPTALPAESALNQKSVTANQVGLAWQNAARDLKFSQPALYDQLSQRVMQLVGSKTLVDQTTELKQMEDETAVLRLQLDDAQKDLEAVLVERDTVFGALAGAVPQLAESRDRLAVALARVQWLVEHGAVKPSKAGKSTAASAGPSTAADPDGHIPTPEQLEAIAAGKRKFTKPQQEWALGEAMVLCGFRYTHSELLENGEDGLARMILDARKA